jgi:hypothetical protein
LAAHARISSWSRHVRYRPVATSPATASRLRSAVGKPGSFGGMLKRFYQLTRNEAQFGDRNMLLAQFIYEVTGPHKPVDPRVFAEPPLGPSDIIRRKQ